MDAATWVALLAAMLATVISVTVPLMTFRLALRQDHVRWIREQRAELYVDMLTEAQAEYEWLEYKTAGEDARERAEEWFTDKRLPPLERERLGARGTIFGSRTVNQIFNRLAPEAFWQTIGLHEPDPGQIRFRMQLGEILDDLQEAVRRELGTDRVPLNGPGASAPAAKRSNARSGRMPPPSGEKASPGDLP